MRQRHLTLQQVARSLCQGLPVSDILQQIADVVREDLQVDCCWMSDLHQRYSINSSIDAIARWQEWDCAPYCNNLAAGKVVTLHDNASLEPTVQQLLQMQGIRSLLIVPLQYQQTRVGEIVVAQSEQHPWTSDEIEWVQTLSDFGAIALHQAHLEAQLAQVAEDITECKAIETQQEAATLNQSEERYKALVDASPDLLFRLDRDGIYLDFHVESNHDLYTPPDRLIGFRVSEILPPDLAAQVMQAIYSAFDTGNLQVFEYELQIHDEQRYYEARVVRSGDAEVVAIVRDITEWKRTEVALRESEERWQFAISGSQAGIWDWNVITDEIFYSPRWKELHDIALDAPGYSIEEWRARVHPDDRPVVQQALQEHLSQKTPFYEAEYRVQRQDSSYIWISDRGQGIWDEAGTLIRLSGSETDITERKQAELSLKESETQLRLALEAAEMGVWNYDILTKQETWMGRSEAIFGFAPGTFDNNPETFIERVHPDDRDLIRYSHELAIESPTCQFEYRIIHPDNSIRWIASRGQVFFDANRQAIKMTGVDMDVTERKQIEEQLKASLEEKNTLLQEVHHRVKNNLQTVSSLLRLQTSSIQDPAILKLFEDSQSRVRAMALIHELLYQSANLARIDFATYVKTLATDLLKFYTTRSHQIQLHLNLAPVELSINCAIPCGLIINELITNALKYAFVDRTTGTITIQFYQNDLHQYELIVQDDGIGISEDLNLLQQQSLGMRLISALTRQLHGSITLDRQPTTFKMVFSA